MNVILTSVALGGCVIAQASDKQETAHQHGAYRLTPILYALPRSFMCTGAPVLTLYHGQGCASDVQIHGYCYSNILKPDWKKSRGSQPEILAYLMDVADRYDIRRHCVFNTSVVKAEWDDSASLWRIATSDKKGEISVVYAKIFVSAMGILVQPRIPSIPGASDFQGPQFHSAQYRNDVDLRGKKVAVIGNGCSA